MLYCETKSHHQKILAIALFFLFFFNKHSNLKPTCVTSPASFKGQLAIGSQVNKRSDCYCLIAKSKKQPCGRFPFKPRDLIAYLHNSTKGVWWITRGSQFICVVVGRYNMYCNSAVSVQLMMEREIGFNNKRRALKPVVPEILTAGTPLWRWDGVS